tara:strand:+ start:5840 stop:6559 length:720 start_codon:yes stop_codon:yes gene_type:complete
MKTFHTEKAFNELIKKSKTSSYSQINNFPKFIRRQQIAKFLARYEVFKRQVNIKGSIVECGVDEGFGVMTFAHFSAILEPYQYFRKIIAFDTFAGFPSISDKDKKNKKSKKGTFKRDYNTYDDLKKSINTFDKNRFLNNRSKIELIKGDAIKTIPKYLKKNKHLLISLLWLDFDIYEPTKVALENFLPIMPKGSIIVFDELNNKEWPGETLAFLDQKNIKYKRLETIVFEPNLSFIQIK